MFLQRINKKIAIVFALLILHQAIFPNLAFALTGGPSQPEVESFKPIGATDMVDLFTGDFSYNIPLLDIDGYPINISYQSNPSMDEEASWVGLGWTLNPGVMNRDLRGLPDDFNGDVVKREFTTRPNYTVGFSAGGKLEAFGFFSPSFNGGFFYNSYRGFGREAGVNLALQAGDQSKPFSLGVNSNSQSGLDVDLKFYKNGWNISSGINSRNGFKDVAWGTPQWGVNGAIGFQQRTYFPTAELPYLNYSYTFDGSLGPEFTGFFAAANLKGYYTVQDLAFKKNANRAYGYLYLQNGQDGSVGNLMDYNQEKVRPFRYDIPNIPIPFGTYDLFTASGQGVSGQFRAVRNEVGNFGGQQRKNVSASTSGGLEAGPGNVFKKGVNINQTNVYSTSKEWTKSNRATAKLKYTAANQLYENVFFKNTGENVPTDPAFFTSVGAEQAVKVGLKGALADARWEKEKNKQSQGSISMPGGNLQRSNREKRNQVFSYLTAQQATAGGLDKQILSHKERTITYPYPSATGDVVTINRTGQNFQQDHHISEVTVTQEGGGRYVYGLPLYNKVQKEVTFSVNKNAAIVDPNNLNGNFGLVAYDQNLPGNPNPNPNPDNSLQNNQGKEAYYDQQEIPSYTYAHLLTAVLSPDYSDRTGNGISDDDPGTAVKINYTKVQENYAWRTPTQAGFAKYIEGRKSDPSDDKGTYLYGEKEVWNVHSIESRTMIAQFYVSKISSLVPSEKRNDAFSTNATNNGNGGIGSAGLCRLDSIRLYSKSELRAKGPNNAVPIKTVLFEYDYSLCKKVVNNIESNQGKLTLKKIRFKYQHSGKGKLNPYVFEYATNNPDYNQNHVDRWGMHQKNPANHPNNLDFPYSLQNPAQLSPDAWNLNQIILPSGAKINVEYESDDYAYVQNRRAAKMTFIQGFARETAPGSGNLTTPVNNLYDPASGNHVINDYIIIGTEQFNISSWTNEQIRKQFLEGVKQIYFNANVALKSGVDERISGYMELDATRLPIKLSNGTQLAIPVKKVKGAKNKDTHPISFAAFQTMRLELPDVTYGSGPIFQPGAPLKTQMNTIIRQLIGRSRGNELSSLFKGFEQTAMKNEWARTASIGETTTNRSWIRLPDPDYIKYGGGSRVKKLTIDDQWNIAQGGGASTYGQEYNYRMYDDEVGATVSSGVASYEPSIGNEENALRDPLPYKEKVLLGPSNYYYTETPIGESLYPAPVVGYRQVTVKNISYANVSRTATGYSVVKFWTAKEFPVIADFTNNQGAVTKTNALGRFFRLNAVDFATISQGFVVEVNDMHGKMREETVYNEAGAQIRSTKYEYKVDNPKADQLHLNNTVSVVQPDRTIGTALMGLDFDIWQDMQEESHQTLGAGLQLNIDGFIIVTPVVAFYLTTVTPIPSLQNEHTRLRTAATTKFIKRYGILDKVIVNENGSVATTRNVLFDSETGNVLLTETQNEFNDNVYAFNYPAHWMYPGMGQAYKNIGATVGPVTLTDGLFDNLNNPGAIFMEGDEVIIQKTSSNAPELQKYHIMYCDEGDVEVVNSSGVPVTFTENLTVTVVRSGARNLAGTSVGAVESLVNPAASSPLMFDAQSKVINASATTFNNKWTMYCESNPISPGFYQATNTINPFANGKLGNWRPHKNYVFYTDRAQIITASPSNRSAGAIPNFVPFWSYNEVGGVWGASASTPWTVTKEITLYDIRGNVVETKNAIGVYAASQFGYNQTRVTAVADNATYRDMAYEGFEDLSFNSADVGQYPLYVAPDQGMMRKLLFGYNPNTAGYDNLTLDASAAHTGKFSIRLNPGNSSIAKISQISSNCIGPNSPNLNCSKRNFICEDCLPKTALGSSSNTVYTISVWVATSNTLSNGGYVGDDAGIGINVKYIKLSDQTSVSELLKPSGPVVDGWQRVEGKITVPNDKEVLIELKNGSGLTAYFDDFRFHPWKSNMKSFVYDFLTMRLIAELDENNYAMFYEYDDEGKLIRVKKETEKGVMTVKEARSNLKPNAY